MKANNRKRKSNENPKMGFFRMLLGLFTSSGKGEEKSYKQAYHQAFMEGGNPEFYPRKHIVMNYATQNRIAKNRRKVLSKASKR
jgi:hypothetical protein